MRKFSIILIFLVNFQIMACGGEKKMNIIEPYYYVKLNMIGCVRIVAVNGFEIESDFDGYSSTAEIPINHLIKSGKNKLELILPSDEYLKENWSDNKKCTVDVWVSGLENDEEVNYKVADIDFSGDYSSLEKSLYDKSMKAGNYKFSNGETLFFKDGKDSILGEVRSGVAYEPGMPKVLERDFLANVSFPEWKFFEGEDLFGAYHPAESDDEYNNARDEIWKEVEKITGIFESQDIGKIVSLFELRSAEYDQAFYREPGNTLAQLKNSLENVYENEYPLNTREKNEMQMLVTYTNKMVTMVNAATYNGTVMFYDHKSNSNTFYTIYWMKKDGEWIIAR